VISLRIKYIVLGTGNQQGQRSKGDQPTMNPKHSFKVIAHRGASAHAPGNTSAAFRLAIETHAPLIETDVRLTADGILILEHDEDTGGLLVSDATLAELRAANPSLLTVAAALKEFGQENAFCWEVKAPNIAPALVNLIRDLTPESVWAQTEFTSFIWKNTLALRQLAPETVIGWLTTDWNQAVIQRVASARLNQICPPAASVLADVDLIETAHAAGLQVRVWQVSTLALVPALAAAGVDGGTVNFPAEALDALR
jgi:glycerophosphoryl diester phosphodiesterase